MPNFVTDLTTLPNGKSDLIVSPVPANNKVTATEWNTFIQASYDLRGQLLEGNYHGLTDTMTATADSAAGKSRFRQRGNFLETSIDGGHYQVISEKTPGVINVCSFGAVGDDATDNAAAFEAAFASIPKDTTYGRTIYIPPGKYRFSRSLNITRCVVLCGASGWGWYSSSVLKFPAGVHGLILHAYNTNPDGGSLPGGNWVSAGWSVLRDFGVESMGSNATTAHGVIMYSRAKLENMHITGFENGNVVNIEADVFGSPTPLTAWAPSTTYRVGDSVHNATVWAPSTAYAAGDRVSNAGQYYFCVTPGTSAASGGPTGIATGIVDGGVTWDRYSGWYYCKAAGTSAASGGPSGVNFSITDGGVTWGYIAGTNANGWQIWNCRITGGINCVYTRGGDANAGMALGVDTGYATNHCFSENSFLGNAYIACQADSGGGIPYYAMNAAAASSFIQCYAENNVNPSEIHPNSTVIGGGHGAGFATPPSGIIGQRMGVTTWWVDGVADTFSLGGDALITLPPATRLKYVPYDGVPTGVKSVLEYRWGNLDRFNGNGQASSPQALFQTGSEPARYMNPTQLWVAMGFGMMIEGKRVSFCDSTSRPDLGFGGPVTDAEGDYIFKRAAVIGESAGWVCIEGGTSSTYTEGLTATSAGGTSLTLSGNTHVTHGLQIGDRVLINGVTTYVTNRGTGPTTSITVADAIPAGSGLAIAYVPGVYGLLPQIETAIQDDSGSPSTTYTQDATAGKFVIMSGEHVVIVNNAYCTTNSIITCSLGTLDLGISGHWRVACGAGGFIFETNSNATNNVTVSWVLRN